MCPVALNGPEQRPQRPASKGPSNSLILDPFGLISDTPEGVAVVYFLRLRSGTLYIGCTTDLVQRVEDHATGQACRTTARDRPTAVVRVETLLTFSQARRREAQLKRWSRAKKEALIQGAFEKLHSLARSRD